MELSLEFSDVPVLHDRVLQEAAIREVRECDSASGVETDGCLTGSDRDGAGRQEDPQADQNRHRHPRSRESMVRRMGI